MKNGDVCTMIRLSVWRSAAAFWRSAYRTPQPSSRPPSASRSRSGSRSRRVPPSPASRPPPPPCLLPRMRGKGGGGKLVCSAFTNNRWQTIWLRDHRFESQIPRKFSVVILGWLLTVIFNESFEIGRLIFEAAKDISLKSNLFVLRC